MPRFFAPTSAPATSQIYIHRPDAEPAFAMFLEARAKFCSLSHSDHGTVHWLLLTILHFSLVSFLVALDSALSFFLMSLYPLCYTPHPFTLHCVSIQEQVLKLYETHISKDTCMQLGKLCDLGPWACHGMHNRTKTLIPR